MEVTPKKVASLLGRLTNQIGLGANYVGVSLIAVIAVSVCADVFSRFVFNAPVPGATEFAYTMLVGIVYLTLADTQAKREHIGVGLVVMRLPPRLQVCLNLVIWILALGIFIIMVWQTGRLAWSGIQVGEYTSGLAKFPIWPARSLIPLGCAILCARLVLDICHEVRFLFRPASVPVARGGG